MEKKLFCFLFLISLSSALWGQEITFSARASKTEVSINERFSIQFLLSSEERNLKIDAPIRLPDFNGLHQLAESQQSNFQIINGQFLNQSGIEVILVADREGEYTIGPATIVIGGKKYATKPITIVVKQGLKPKVKPNQRLQGAFLMTEVNRENPFLNQEVILVVKIYARDYSILNRLRNYNEPDFASLVAKYVSEKTDDNIRQEIVNGQTYVSQELARYIVFPQKVGNIEIDPFSIDVVISGYYGAETVQLTSQPITLKVKSLPEDKPKHYSGAVGSFKLNASISKEEVKANETVNLEIEIIGNGNMSALKTPEVELSEHIETYAPKRRDAFEARPSGMKGKVIENQLLVPQYGGNYAIGPIRFSYFDPEEGKYITLTTRPLMLKVEGPLPPANSALTLEDSLANKEDITDYTKTDSTSISKIFVPEKLNEVKEVVTSVSRNNGWMWYVLTLLGALLILLIWKKKKRNPKKEIHPTEKKSKEEFKSELKPKLNQLKTLAKENRSNEFSSLQEEILTQLGMHFTQTKLAEFTEDSVAKKLSEIYPEALAQTWKKLLLESKQAKYAKFASFSDLEQLFKETDALCEQFFAAK